MTEMRELESDGAKLLIRQRPGPPLWCGFMRPSGVFLSKDRRPAVTLAKLSEGPRGAL